LFSCGVIERFWATLRPLYVSFRSACQLLPVKYTCTVVHMYSIHLVLRPLSVLKKCMPTPTSQVHMYSSTHVHYTSCPTATLCVLKKCMPSPTTQVSMYLVNLVSTHTHSVFNMVCYFHQDKTATVDGLRQGLMSVSSSPIKLKQIQAHDDLMFLFLCYMFMWCIIVIIVILWCHCLIRDMFMWCIILISLFDTCHVFVMYHYHYCDIIVCKMTYLSHIYVIYYCDVIVRYMTCVYVFYHCDVIVLCMTCLCDVSF